MSINEIKLRAEGLINGDEEFNSNTKDWILRMNYELHCGFQEHWLNLGELLEANKLLSKLRNNGE